ncbi:RNA polymerase sigma factor [Clostridium lacusfryxellense]|uniref:RNA polymerase sigma factor n=1 Tax=Clostridium lacusfryxellense TaxID=205328 RepID=UPI001C0B4511|nr:RNA polymerase sigma factor [Clostridium lacusfryxellense]MBU3114453.1 RNA polymerase sigma factor [Clostridium lacusfryxellense]
MKQLENFYIIYKQDVYMYLLSLTHNPNLSEDLLSETFVASMSSFVNFRGQSTVKTWLCSIARNLWLQSIRKENHIVEYNDLLQLYASDSIAEKLITKETVKRIKALLLEKDERTQKIVNMRVNGYSFGEIAHDVNISESSARVIDFRTKKWIKSILEKEELG